MTELDVSLMLIEAAYEFLQDDRLPEHATLFLDRYSFLASALTGKPYLHYVRRFDPDAGFSDAYNAELSAERDTAKRWVYLRELGASNAALRRAVVKGLTPHPPRT